MLQHLGEEPCANLMVPSLPHIHRAASCGRHACLLCSQIPRHIGEQADGPLTTSRTCSAESRKLAVLLTKKTLSWSAAALARLLASAGSVVMGFSMKTWKPAPKAFKPISAWAEWEVATTTPSVWAAAGDCKNSSLQIKSKFTQMQMHAKCLQAL